MANGFSQYQQSQLGVSAAKARAISERSQAGFRTGLTAIQEREALQRASDQLEKIAKEANRKANKRRRRAGFGRLIGGTLGFVLGGPAGKAALGTALGSLAGTAAAGGLRKYDVDIPDSLVPGGVFFPRDREQIEERKEDIEEAMDELTKQERIGAAKNTFVDFLTGRGLAKIGADKIGDLDVSLDELLETGQISKKDYLKDVFRTATGGIGDKRMMELSQLQGSSLENVTPNTNFISSLGTDKRLEDIRTAFSDNVDVLDLSNVDVLKQFDDIKMDDLNYLQLLNPNLKKRNSLFQQTVGPMGGING